MASSTFIAPEDDDFFDPGYDSNSTTTSYLTSIASSVRRGVEEYGRTYASFGKHQQAIPQDEEEMDRNDLQHAKFMLLLGDKLHLAPIPEPKNVLDLGTGTGIWAMDMADRHPNAQVVGVDISPTQPTWIPPNCQFQIDDIEEEWPSSTKYDFIFGRELLLTIHDWPRLMQQAYLALKPGGYLELEMTVPRVACSDGSFDVESSTWETAAKCLFEMAAKMGTPLEAVELWKKQLTDIGFEAVEEQILPIPVGSWPKDKRLKAVGAFELANLDAGLDSLGLRGFVNILGRPQEEWQVLAAGTRKEFMNPKHHCNVWFHVVYGRKPLEGKRADA